MNILKLLVPALLLASALASCSNGCEESRDSMCGIAYTSVSGNAMQRISIISLRKSVVIDGKEQVFADSTFRVLNSGATTQELRLDPNDTHTAFAMDMIFKSFGDSYTARDTLNVWYTPETHYIDMECGCTVFFNIDSINTTNNLITNAIIKDNVVMNVSSQINIELEY